MYPREFTAEFYGKDGQLKYAKQPIKWGESVLECFIADSYEVKITNLMDGWQLSQKKFIVNVENPNLEITVTPSIQTGAAPNGTVYDTASVLHDLNFYDFKRNKN